MSGRPFHPKGVGKRTASPTLEQEHTIKALAERLGLAVEVPATQLEAEFVIDDLRHRERRARRGEP